ncbi:MAG: bifunctional folylpolyglutamate synthase/dihydrofolate synthase [Thermoplasmatales archaeon]|jgi:dihydrofolate synthase/folylpolyglutamate synthase|nr:bifunctional folylpolyglutamate synthase/dihydrofolate synthase [Thermoplasmatales archaeon]
MKLGLRNTGELLSALGDPQNDFRSIHVAGTDGKGSVAAITASILRKAGIRTGLYTSPHLESFNERICADGIRISDGELADHVSVIRPKVEEMASRGLICTFFEVTTVIAFLHFREVGVEYAVIEVGMGGRDDATNVITPDVSVITNISLEHTEYLGDTTESIAAEKAGIIKEGVPVVTQCGGPPLEVIRARAAESGSDVTVVSAPEIVSLEQTGTVFMYEGERYTVSLAGRHQALNAVTAMEAVRLLGDGRINDAVIPGLRDVVWPARLQKLPGRPIVLDVTHTVSGARDLADDISEIYGRVTLVIGVLSDKNLRGIAENLAPVVNRAVITSPDSDRAMLPDAEMARISEYIQDAETAPTIGDAIKRALEIRGEDTVLITGSHFMIGEAVRWLEI